MGYPVWWDTTITVYNQYKDPLTGLIVWYNTTLSKCFWKSTGNKVTVGTVQLETNSTICRIPKNDKFKERYLWEQLTNDTMKDYFTLSPGDIIVKGDVSDTIDETTKGKRSTDLIAKYKKLQGCIVIKSYANNSGIGRNDKHYYVTGE